MQIGLVGLQFSGKTTLFNTLSRHEQTDTFKKDASIEVIQVPDKRLDELTKIFKPKKQTNATLEIFDIPGLQTGDDGKIKFTSQFMSNVRNNDALFYIIRNFQDESIPHPLIKVDPIRDINFLDTEFIFSDLSIVDKRIQKVEKDAMKSNDDNLKKELALLKRSLEHLENEKPLRIMELTEAEKKIIAGFQLLTLKPLVIAINFDDSFVGMENEEIEKIRKGLHHSDVQIIPFYGKIEFEISQLDEEDKFIFMQDYGITELMTYKMIRTIYQILGLNSFLTTGEDECRAWTIKVGSTAQYAAGVIHTDFYDKFIKAEVVHYDDFMKYGSFAKCKDAGVWHLEGKEYIVKDGDILIIRHG
ncbi:MAG: redox-regulated ATPase YchF [Ignavibacteriales bacterium]|nr:redox-regulated ATPase YchF [Ignavibacteriales bacterium]